MRELSLTSPSLSFVNAAELVAGAEGLIPLRFPTTTLQSFDASMVPIARMATGIELHLHGRLTQVRLALRVLASDGYGLYAELYRGPSKLLPTWRLDPESTTVQTATFCVTSYTQDAHPVRVIFPTHCQIEVVGVAVADSDRPAPGIPFDYRALPGAIGKRWLVHGDSITQGANVTCPTASWVDICARTLGLQVCNLGIGGHGRAELAMAHYLASRTDVDLLTLHLGINAAPTDSEASFRARFTDYLAIIRAAHPTLPLLITSPIFSFYDLPDAGDKAQAIRRAMAHVCAARVTAGDRHLSFVNGLEFGFTPDHLLADCLHINEAGACHYVMHLLPHLRRLALTGA
jgi:hypothetical protein